MPRFGAIDLGSNALRLRIVEAAAHGAASWKEVASLRAPVRLGSEVFVTGKLTPGSIGQACAALRDFRAAMDEHKVDAYRATATSAVREASNAATLAERARREAGIELEVIEGIEEARLIQLAVSRRVALHDLRALLVDVGGGSTELTYLDRGKDVFSISLPLGTVRLLETYLRGPSTITTDRARLLSEGIDRAFAEAIPHLGHMPIDLVIGTGGNLETLCDLCPMPGGAGGVARAVDVGAMRALLAELSTMNDDERRTRYGLRPDRADTIVPAASIFLRAAEVFKVAAIAAPGTGLKEGILEELSAKFFHVWDEAQEVEGVLSACRRLGRRYQFDEKHGDLVARMAVRLFDELTPLHGLGQRDRLLLQAASLLHDVGDFVRYDGHHKHSYYLILHGDIMGLSRDERAVVANVARYHRKSHPEVAHSNFRELDKDARAKVRSLAAILRIADALDREHLGKVETVVPRLDAQHGRLHLALVGTEDRSLEEWTVHAKAGLLAEVFDLAVVLAERRVSSAPRSSGPVASGAAPAVASASASSPPPAPSPASSRTRGGS